MATITMPAHLRDNPIAKKIFSKVKAHLKRSGESDQVDADVVAAYAVAVSEVYEFDEDLAEKGKTQIDKNGFERRRPQIMMRKDALDRMIQLQKLIGLDRCYRMKGKSHIKQPGLGEPKDKAAALRKIGRRA